MYNKSGIGGAPRRAASQNGVIRWDQLRRRVGPRAKAIGSESLEQIANARLSNGLPLSAIIA